MYDPDNDQEVYASSERHSQLMQELGEIGNRLAWGCLGIIVVAISAIICYFWRN